MKLKYLSLLILFILNVTTTVVADSTHVDFVTSTENSQSDCDHNAHLQKSDEDHDSNHQASTQGHDCCHENHVHYYNVIPSLDFVTDLYMSDIDFTFSPQKYPLTALDIIKPPLV